MARDLGPSRRPAKKDESLKPSKGRLVDGVSYRPSLDEVKLYYSRPDVLGEIAGAMRRWHVRLEPGERSKHRWLNNNDCDTLRAIFSRLLGSMAVDRRRVRFPYLRIDARRYEPVTSWRPEDLWGLDFMLEKDGAAWWECWDAVVPVIRILDHFGVHYWLKYTGHHSLHVIVPAENFPTHVGKLHLLDYLPSLYRRLIAFFDRRCCQPLNEGGFHGGCTGTNMPYTLNEDTGLLNYPVLKREMVGFDPTKAHPTTARIRCFWREFPDEKRGCAKSLIEEVLRPFDEQAPLYPGVAVRPPVALEALLREMASPHLRDRKEAVVRLPWFGAREATDAILRALRDRSSEVRKAAAKALVGIDDPRCTTALSDRGAESSPKVTRWIQGTLKIVSDIETLRRRRP